MKKKIDKDIEIIDCLMSSIYSDSEYEEECGGIMYSFESEVNSQEVIYAWIRLKEKIDRSKGITKENKE